MHKVARDCQRADRAHAQRIAVRRRLRGEVEPDRERTAGAIVDDDLLANLLAERCAENSCHRVGGAAGGLRHDQMDRPVGKLCVRRAGKRAGDEGDDHVKTTHWVAPAGAFARRRKIVIGLRAGRKRHDLIRLRAAVGARAAAAGGQMERLGQIQFRRRQQRSGSRAGRPVDRRDDRCAPARRHDARDLWPGQRPARLPAAARVSCREAQAHRRHRLHGRRNPHHLGFAAGARSGQRRPAGARRHRSSSRPKPIRARSIAGRGSASTPSAFRSTATACAWTRSPQRSTISKPAACAPNTSTPSRPCRIRPARS